MGRQPIHLDLNGLTPKDRLVAIRRKLSFAQLNEVLIQDEKVSDGGVERLAFGKDTAAPVGFSPFRTHSGWPIHYLDVESDVSYQIWCHRDRIEI